MAILSKYKLPNGNVFLWLGHGTGVEKNLGIDNVLILEGGEVLLLRNAISTPLFEPEVINDFKKEDPQDLAYKYGIPISRGLIEELKKGVLSGEYPPYKLDGEKRISAFVEMISYYIQRLPKLTDTDSFISHLEDIIRLSESEISKVDRSRIFKTKNL